jgi:protein SCO1/2
LLANMVLPLTIAVLTAGSCLTAGCTSKQSAPTGLPNLSLVDQNGNQVALSSLKGKPLLIDFIYTSCPGPCLTLTQSMERIAQKLGPALGSQITFVSISIDPEHEGPPQLLAYAKKQDANRPGWLFLSGGPSDVDTVLAGFNLTRQRAPDGEIEHMEEVFLVGPDGHIAKEYKGEVLHADSVLADIEHASGRG